jgi:hypothetical protein
MSLTVLLAETAFASDYMFGCIHLCSQPKLYSLGPAAEANAPLDLQQVMPAQNLMRDGLMRLLNPTLD